MTAPEVDTPEIEQAIAAIYASLADNNHEINDRIKALKTALAAAGRKSATFAPARLAQNNRAGRKTMQTYFKKRGVIVTFGDSPASESSDDTDI